MEEKKVSERKTILGFLETVPELAIHVLSFLDVQDIFECMRLSHFWFEKANSQTLWQTYFERDFLIGGGSTTPSVTHYGATLNIIVKESDTYKSLYKQTLLVCKTRRQFLSEHYTKCYDEGMGGKMNTTKHLIGICYRGDINSLIAFLKDPKSQKKNIQFLFLWVRLLF